MANANISTVTITNTFDEWRTRTNSLITDRNILRNHPYVKDNSNFTIANGAVSIARAGGGVLLQVVGADGDALIGGETTTTDLTVGIDALIGNSLIVGTSTANGNTIIYGNVAISKNTVISQNANVAWGVNIGRTLEVVGNTQLYSNATISKNTSIGQNTYITGDVFVDTNKFIVHAPTGDVTLAGDLTVSGGDIVANTATLNLVNTVVDTLDFARNATLITMGNLTGSVNLQGDLLVFGGDITSRPTTNLLNSGTTTINFGGAATTVEIGAASGTTNINHDLDVDGNAVINGNLDVDGDVNIDGGDITVSTATMNIANTTATTVNFAGSATALNMGATSGTTTVRNNLTVTGDITVNGGDFISTAIANVANTSATEVNLGGSATTVRLGSVSGSVTARNDMTVTGDLTVTGGDIISTGTANVANTSAIAVNLGGSALTVRLGSSSGTTVARHDMTVTNDLEVSGGDITGPGTFNLANTSATAVNLGGSAITVRLGSTGGTTVARNDLTVTNDLTVSGGDITTTTATTNLINGTATTVNFAGAATSLNMGAAAGSVTIAGDLVVSGGDITSTATANLLNATTTTLNLGGAATAINMGSGAGSVTIAGDLAVNGGDITGPSVFNLANTTGTAVNLGGAAANVVLGSPSGTVNVRNQLHMTDNIYIPQGKNLFAYYIQTSSTESFYIERGNGVFKNLSVSGTFTLSQPSITTSDRIILNEVPSPARDGYITVRRGTSSSNASLQWLETSGVWRAGGSDGTLSTIITSANVVDSFTSSSLVNVPSANSVRWALANGTFGGTLKGYKDFIVTDTNVSGSRSIDINASNWYRLTLTGGSGTRTLTFTNPPPSGTGATVTVVVIQDASGGKTPSFAGGTIYWAGGQIPPASTAANARDLWTFTTFDGGSTYIGTLAVKDAR